MHKKEKDRSGEPYRRKLATPLPRTLDRRVRITPKKAERITELRAQGLGYQSIANRVEVSKRAVYFFLNPDKYEKAREQFKERRKDGRYTVSKEERTRIQREHRHYKLNVIKA